MKADKLLAVIDELKTNAQKIDQNDLGDLVALCLKAKRVFLAGAGRSGFAARGFANRLMQMGLTVYFAGETTTPAIGKGDLLIIGSGSGSTTSLVQNAKKAKAAGAYIATITIYADAPCGAISDAVVKIPGGTPKNETGEADTATSIQPMGTLFEQLSWITYDTLILELMAKTGETAETMFPRHANLE